MRSHTLLLSCLGVLLFQSDIRAQSGPSARPLQFDRFSLQEGLPSNTVTEILQDRYGFLWIGTQNGLARFDGYRFTTYAVEPNPGDTPTHSGISGTSIEDLLEDSAGHLWVGTWNGVNRYERETDSFVHYLRDPEPHPAGYSQSTGYTLHLYEDRAGTVWVGTPTGLFRYHAEGDSLHRLAPRPELETYQSVARETKGNEIHDLLEDRSGRFWVATYDNLYQLDRAAERFVPFVHRVDSAFGTPVRQAYSLFETSSGDLWIVAKAHDGIDRYDPLTGRATRYRLDGLRSTPDYVSPNAPYLQEDASGHLWLIATEGDLYRWAEGSTSFQRVDVPVEAIPDVEWGLPPRSVLELDGGDVLFGSGDRGLIRILPDGSHEQYLFDPRASITALNGVRSLYRDRFGSVWIGARQGLYRLNTDASLFELGSLGSSSVGVSDAVTSDAAAGVWVGLGGSKLVYQPLGGGAARAFQANRPYLDSLWIQGITDLYMAPDRRLWISGTGGIDILDPSAGTFEHIGYIDTTYSPQAIEKVRSLSADGRAVASILRPGDGANLTRPFRLSASTDLLVAALGECASAALGMDDSGWIENEAGDRVWAMDCTRVLHAGGNSRNVVQMAVVTLPAGSYRLRYRADFCGSDVTCHAFGAWNVEPPAYPEWYGIQLLRLESSEVARTRDLLEPWAPVDLLPDIRVVRFHEDRAGRLWIGTLNELARKLDDDHHFVSYALPVREGQQSGDAVLAIHDGPDGAIWVGTSRDLLRFDEATGSFTRIEIGDPVPVIRIATEESGNVWFATGGRGLGVYRRASQAIDWYSEDTADLPSEHIMSMERDESGRLWLLSAAGLTRFDPLTETQITFSQAHGLPSFSLGGASLRTPRGELLFSGDNGFVRFRPTELRANPVPPQVVMTHLSFSGANAGRYPGGVPAILTGLSGIEIPYDFNDFTIDYVGLHFVHPERNQYMVKLENYDVDWQRVGDRRSRSFTNLDPGRYVLRVRAANADGIWSDVDAALEIVIHPPWWRTVWAYLGYIVVLVGGLFGAATTQRRVITARERRRSEIESARLRAEAAELESRALKAETERQRNVELLSRIGRDITSTLSIEQVIDTVYENVNALMDAAVFGIGLVDEQKRQIHFPGTKEKGERLPPYANSLDEKDRLAVWCHDHREEIVINDYRQEYQRYVQVDLPSLEGGDPESILYLPLIHQDRLIGVITTQSFRKGAYSDYHVNLLRNLATYTAIALDNAATYRKLGATVDDLRKTQQQLVHQEKLASLGQLTAGIAHEIKNPLNFVNNFADLNSELIDEVLGMLRDNPERPVSEVLADLEAEFADLRENAAQIARHGKRADGIVQAMMQHARGDSGQHDLADVNELVEEYVNLAFHGKRAASTDFQATIETRLDEKTGSIPMAAQEIGRVILNLVGNAFDAVSLRAETDGPPYYPTVTVSTSRLADGSVEIRVSDNGTGIPPQVRERLFEPFFTTKPAGAGTGLGLSLSYDVVTAGHGGTLTVEDAPDGGAVFVVRLPG